MPTAASGVLTMFEEALPKAPAPLYVHNTTTSVSGAGASNVQLSVHGVSGVFVGVDLFMQQVGIVDKTMPLVMPTDLSATDDANMNLYIGAIGGSDSKRTTLSINGTIYKYEFSYWLSDEVVDNYDLTWFDLSNTYVDDVSLTPGLSGPDLYTAISTSVAAYTFTSATGSGTEADPYIVRFETTNNPVSRMTLDVVEDDGDANFIQLGYNANSPVSFIDTLTIQFDTSVIGETYIIDINGELCEFDVTWSAAEIIDAIQAIWGDFIYNGGLDTTKISTGSTWVITILLNAGTYNIESTDSLDSFYFNDLYPTLDLHTMPMFIKGANPGSGAMPMFLKQATNVATTPLYTASRQGSASIRLRIGGGHTGSGNIPLVVPQPKATGEDDTTLFTHGY